MLRNWGLSYLGNFVGSVAVAVGCAFFGQFNYTVGQLAVSTVRCAVGKCSMSFGNAFIMGLFCNILVCTAVLLAFASKDITGKILGIFVPVCLFVICGFEHSIANMYYVPAGLFALKVPGYAKIISAGPNIAMLTWRNFLTHNLLPVTLGNIVGGVAIGTTMWAAYGEKN
jgi:formate/nitrite transporter